MRSVGIALKEAMIYILHIIRSRPTEQARMACSKAQPRLQGSCSLEPFRHKHGHQQDVQVPAIAHGGPNVDPTNPSPESVKIAKSFILLEFIADPSRLPPVHEQPG